FNSTLKKDWGLKLEHLDREIDQSKEAFIAESGDIKKLFPTFGKVIRQYLKEQQYDQMPLDEKWQLITRVLTQLNDPAFYITDINGNLHLSLLSDFQVIESFNDPIQAINSFFVTYITNKSFLQLKNKVLSRLNKNVQQTENYINKTQRRLHDIENRKSYRQIADLIMANLHQIESGQKEVTLQNFYNKNEPVQVKLNKDLSPQKNAEIYYKKAKNQSKEIQSLIKSLESKENQLKELQEHLQTVEEITVLKSLKAFLTQNPHLEQQKQDKESHKPFKAYNIHGYAVYVGKNARSNDQMLQQYTYKEDLWLHAKDVSGSHVIIKHQAGSQFPRPVIEKAAQLAAYHSKRKTDSLCPVIVTPRKYVRKRKGDPAGAVVVDKEEVILVPPDNNP
ncbi:MAG: NFACT RNA binding domain-containing protein, partial [Fulvivirga sp.]|nr:NFACT RNA binding domain-containing protein [Fulvivirga sp.]